MAAIGKHPGSEHGPKHEMSDPSCIVVEGIPVAASDPTKSESTQYIRDAERDIRMGFVRKVYTILSVQLALTVGIAIPIYMAGADFVAEYSWLSYVAIGVMVFAMCSMCCCPGTLKHFPTNYLFLFLITLAMSIVVGIVSVQYTWQSVVLAAGLTVVIFVGMTIYAWTTKADFTGAGPYLFAAALVLLMFAIAIPVVALIFGLGVVSWMVMLIDFLGVLLFTFYIVYDTQLMIGSLGEKQHTHQFSVDDYAFAALNLYLDIINLFLYLLSLFGSRQG